MFVNDLYYFSTINLNAITTIITISTFTYIKYLYINEPNKKIYVNKGTQTESDCSENYTEIGNNNPISNISNITNISNCFIKIDYDELNELNELNESNESNESNEFNESESSLENLIILAKNQLIIHYNPSQYEWIY